MYYLPKFFCPKYTTNLIRLGDEYDGGYCVSKKSIKKSNLLLSFGVGDNWSFEREFKKFKGVKIICFDNSVNIIFWIKRLIKDILNFKLKENYFNQISNFFRYFEFLLFFSKKNNFLIKKNITKNLNNKKRSYKFESADNILDKLRNKKVFLKVDIEGSEYEILNSVIKFQNNLTGLVIEFHNCYKNKSQIIKFIRSFKLDLVHIHVNNFCSIENSGFPTVFELTFSPRQFNRERKKNDMKFPNKKIDSPNNKYLSDEKLFFV